MTKYYRNAHAAVVVYDITSSASLLKAKAWIAELARQADPGIVILLAGNKADLSETQRQVTKDEAQKYAAEEGLLWIECSAKSGEGVHELFTQIGQSRFLTSRMHDYVLMAWYDSGQAAIGHSSNRTRNQIQSWSTRRRTRSRENRRIQHHRRRMRLLITPHIPPSSFLETSLSSFRTSFLSFSSDR